MNVLLAPNGKPSKLTPEQYKLVRTPVFKEWFGDWENESSCQPYVYSQLEVKPKNMLLDKNSEPQVFYHGSDDFGFTIVNVHGSSEQFLFWITTSKEMAERFAGSKKFGYKNEQEYFEKEGKVGGVYSFFVKTNKIFDIFNYNQVEEVSQKLADLIKLNKKYIYNGREIGARDLYSDWNKRDYFIAWWSSKDWNEVESWENDMWIIGMLKELGYDCITNKEGGVINIGFIGNPNQIKLADEMKDELGKVNEKTNTTFDGNNPDIRFEDGGNLEKNKNMENKNKNMENNFAKGGKILGKETEQGFIHNEQQKYARIGVSDIYYIEAYITMGLQGVNFDENSLNEKLKTSLNILYNNYESYLISEDSYGIDIEFDVLINNAMADGLPVENIEQLRNHKINPQKRQEKINEIAFNQKMTLETWIAYLKSSVYSDAFKYLLFSAILDYNYIISRNDLVKRNKKTVTGFTSFDAGVLSILYNTPSIFILKDYVTLLGIEGQKLVNELPSITMENGKWITFRGKGSANDEEIIKNAEKLTQLVQTSNWCTRTGALGQLKGGDSSYKGGNFYVFVIEQGGEFIPKIAVRMNLDEVGEVSGRLPTQDVESDFVQIANKFLTENINNNSGKKWLDGLAYNKKCGEIIKRLIDEGIYPDFVKDYGYILANETKFRTRYGRNGNMELAEQEFNKAYANLPNQHYQQGDFAKDYWTNIQPTTKYFIGDLNLYGDADFDFLGKDLFYILGNLRIENNATTLGNLKYISGDVTIKNQSIQNFGNIESIGGEYIFEGTNLGLTTFGKLKNYGGTIDCITKFNNLIDLGDITEINGNLIIGENSALQTLGKLTKIDGDLICENSKIFELPNLKEITGNVNFKGSQIVTLPVLEKVGSDFIINNSRVKEFPNLTFIGGDAGFQNNFTSTTQNIETILGDLFLLNSRLMQFTNLKKIGKSINIKGSLIQNLGSLQYLGGNLDLAENNKLIDLGNLNYIGGYFNAKSSNLLSLNNVKQIIQFASFIDSNLEDLGALESIGGSVFFNKSNVKNLGKLNFIGGTLTFGERKDLEAEWLKRQANNQTFNDGGTITENGMYATISISLLTRLLELSNEDLKNDIQIHKVIENISNLSEKALTIDDYNSIVQNVNKFDNGGEIVVYSYYGNIPIKLENHWLNEDTDVELVPVKELIKFREFNRNSMPKYNKQDSLDTIDKLAKSFQEEGIKEPLIIEYSADDKSVLLIEGNHRLNSAEMLGIEYLPARIVLRKRPFLPTMKSRSMPVNGVTADDYGYIPSNMKPSKVGIGNTKKVFKEGGIIEGQLHSECNDDTGCGRKFQVGEGGQTIEAEREEAVIVPEVFNSTENMTITGTPSEVASALNVMGGGKNFDDGATINSKKYQGKTDKIKPQAQNTDVDDIIEPSSIIVNRRSMGDSNKYEVTGTPRQIASEINSMNGNGVVIEEGGKITKLT